MAKINFIRYEKGIAMTNHMAEVAKILDVDLGEEFKIKRAPSNCFYKFSHEGLFLYHRDKYGRLENRHGERSTNMLSLLLEGIYEIVKLPWKPAENEIYFIPRIDKPEMACWNIWGNSKTDISRYNLGIVCKAKKDAVAIAEKMLAAIKE